MAAYYKVEVTLNSQAVSVGLPSPQSVRVTLPLVGPQGPQGPQGEPGPPGEVSGTIVWDNVTEKPTTFPPSSHTHTADQIVDFTSAVEAVSPPADWNTLANKPSTFTPSAHGSTHHTGGTDAIAAHQINGQTIFSAGSATYSTDQTLTAFRAIQLTVGNTNASGINLTLPPAAGGTLNGDTYVIIGGSTVAGPITIRRINVLEPLIYETLATITAAGQQFRFRATATTTGGWSLVPVDTHTHPASAITDFTTAAAAAAPVSSVAGRTGAISLAVADVANAVADTDARLSDSRTPTSHAASHLPDGDDELFDQSLNVGDSVNFLNLETELDLTVGGDLFITNALSVGDNGIVFDSNGAENTRTSLGLGNSATADIGTTTGTVAAGDDSRFADIPDPSAATPQPLGSASAGTSDDYSRGDHIHAAPALNDLSNVSAATPSDNDVLVFDTATGNWVAEAPSGGGGASLMQSIAVGFVLN